MSRASVAPDHAHLEDAIADLEIALPVPGDGMDQDEEWLVVHTDDGWQKIRLHDYADVYNIPGLYEKWIYDLFQCRSPQKVADLLIPAAQKAGFAPKDLTVFDLGAGNGYVAEVLSKRGVENFVGVDRLEQAAAAAERDRPGLYNDYIAADLTRLPQEEQATLNSHDFNCLTCVAALGFGDIPPQVFSEAYNRISDGGLIAFTIKRDFLSTKDRSGFAGLIRRMIDENIMTVEAQESFVHRVSTDGDELLYDAFIGIRKQAIPDEWVEDDD